MSLRLSDFLRSDRGAPSFALFSLSIAALALTASGCDTPPAVAGDGGVAASARVVFGLADDPMDFGDIAFPDDLYLDAAGRIALGAIPSEERSLDPAFPRALRASLATLDGFGTTSPVFFPIEGDLDPASLPSSAAASLTEDASVFLLDVDTASPAPFTRVPAMVTWDRARRYLVVAPADGHPFSPGRRYAAVVTSSVRAADGAPLGADPRFAQIRDAMTRPPDALAGAAHDEYGPVLASLATVGVARARVAGLAVFRTLTVGAELATAREQIRRLPAPTLRVLRVASGADLDALLGVQASPGELGTDAAGGVAHEHIAYVVDGTFESPDFTSATPGRHGVFERDGTDIRIKRRSDVYFTLVVPDAADASALPLVIFQHGLGGQRSDVFSFADALAARGFAVASIDAPYHGMRASAPIDTMHRFSSTAGPDHYGDRGGQEIYLDFLGIADTEGELVAFHPFYIRDVFRQSVLDLSALVSVLERGDMAPITSAGGPATLGFDAEHIGFVGISLGGILGTIFVASEPLIGAAVLTVTGGHLSRLVTWSPAFQGSFLPLLFPNLGLDFVAIDWDGITPSSYPETAIYQTLLDGGDSMSFAAMLRAQPTHVLMHMARWDETVPNIATEGLARAIGMPVLGGAATYTDLVAGASPLAGNVMVGSTPLTRGLVVWEPANHGLLSVRRDGARWMHPPEPPFTAATPSSIASPIDDVAAMTAHFFETWVSGSPEIRQ